MSQALQQLIQQAEAQKIQANMNLCYRKNITLLQHAFPSLYKRLEHHRPSGVVLQLDPNGELNLADTATRQYLYNEPPQHYCRKQVNHFKKKQNVQRFKLSTGEAYNDRHIHLQHLNTLIDAYAALKKPALETPITYIPNLIVSGIGLGYSLPLLLDTFDIQHIFIHEACLDTFHASLHTLDWEPIVRHFSQPLHSIDFCVGKNSTQALTDIEFSLQRIGLHAHIYSFIYSHTTRAAEQQFIERYLHEIRAFIGGLGYYDDEQIGLAHGYHNARSSHPVFDSSQTQHRTARLILVGNGPSLDAHTAYLRENTDNAIIMSCGSALGSLLKMGIKPDFHVEMERTNAITDFLHLSTRPEDRENITLLCLHTVAPNAIAAFKEVCYAIKPNDAATAHLHNNVAPKTLHALGFCNPTVTNCGLAFAISMGFKDVHLVGVDLGMPTTGGHHSANSFHYEMEKSLSDTSNFKYAYTQQNNTLVAGNFGGKVKTHTVLNHSRIAMERLLAMATRAFPDFSCTNTNNGAKIQYTLSAAIDSIPPAPCCDKPTEINAIKTAHFYRATGTHLPEATNTGNNTHEPLLSYFMSIEKTLTMSHTLSDNRALQNECQRIYGLIAAHNDPLTHYLLRGSINCLLGVIVENCLYTRDKVLFQQRTQLGAGIFNAFIDNVYLRMKTEPFRLDDTRDPILEKMSHMR